jgi:hypothetical protein
MSDDTNYMLELWEEGTVKENRPKYEVVTGFKGLLHYFSTYTVSMNEVLFFISKASIDDKDVFEAEFDYIFKNNLYPNKGFNIKEISEDGYIPAKLEFSNAFIPVGIDDISPYLKERLGERMFYEIKQEFESIAKQMV